jgi:hypothetical protein
LLLFDPPPSHIAGDVATPVLEPLLAAVAFIYVTNECLATVFELLLAKWTLLWIVPCLWKHGWLTTLGHVILFWFLVYNSGRTFFHRFTEARGEYGDK